MQLHADGNYAGGSNGDDDGSAITGTGTYRYGFNGKENDNEVKGICDQIDYGMRAYDPRAAKFLSLDPLQHEYASMSPYGFVANSPLIFVDGAGKKIILPKNDANAKKFIAALEKMTGYKLERQKDGNLLIIGEKDKPFSPTIKEIVFQLLDFVLVHLMWVIMRRY